MRIAVVQTLYPKGHRSLDEGFVRVLSKEHMLFIVDDGKYFSRNVSDNVNIKRIVIPHFSIKRWEALKRVLRRIDLFFVFLALRIHRCEYDMILFLNIDNDIYKVEKWLPRKKKILFHHNDIDVLLSSNQRVLKNFNLTKRNFCHICLADYISDSFKDYAQLDDNSVFTVHQPLVFDSSCDDTIKEELLVGIGNSMDEGIIKSLVDLDMSDDLPCRLLLRSRGIEYKGRNMDVFTGFVERARYEELYKKSKVSLVTYPLDYKFRYSGIIDDSLSNGLSVISNDTLCGRYFASIYPGSVFIIDNVKDLWAMLKKGLPSQSKKDYCRFRERHSDNYVLEQLNKAIKTQL